MMPRDNKLLMLGYVIILVQVLSLVPAVGLLRSFETATYRMNLLVQVVHLPQRF